MTAGEIRGLRESMELTQAQFASLLGTTWVTVSRWENGHASPTPYQSNLMRAMKKGGEKEPKRVDEARDLLLAGAVVAALGLLLYAATKSGGGGSGLR